jgi:very-short-patch-repair endonuclease
VGFEEERVKALMQRHLAEQVPLYRAQMSPERSIYDLARVVFAHSGVMLREHFRCVPPIIEYSKREFYEHALQPLRLPRASERLDPALVDVLVDGAQRSGGVNPAEADFIVGEIRRLIADPRFARRTIGVVSLLGEEQALRIWERLTEELGAVALQRHGVACGDARAFQGRERDVMFLSMVSAPNDVGAPLSRDIFAQRFNVAASRARDRVYLVRSVGLEHLSEADRLRRGLIAHFARPFGERTAPVDPRDACESALERALYDWLVRRGYRVTPQASVGAWRIDLVVEGAGDARLAVECDGDKDHLPEQWAEDVRRQRALERVGWVVWRCFAATFVRRPDAVLRDLAAALAEAGVEPMTAAAQPARQPVEQRVVRIETVEATRAVSA